MSLREKISNLLNLNEKDSRRMERVIDDISSVSGLGQEEILDFLRYGSEVELLDLEKNYNWEKFRILIQKKLVKR
jgi:hypothetical protein